MAPPAPFCDRPRARCVAWRGPAGGSKNHVPERGERPRTRWYPGPPRSALEGRLRGVVSGVRCDWVGGAHLAGRVRRGWLDSAEARVVEAELAPFNLGRLNPLGLNLAAPALFAHGTEEQRRRFLPPIVANEEVWCQLFSEPGPAPTWRRSPRGASGTVTTGWSRVRRCGARGPTWPTSACFSPGQIRMCPSAVGSPTSSWTCTLRVSMCARCATSPGTSILTRSSWTLSGSPTPAGRARRTKDGRSPTRHCRANGRWSRGRARAASTGSAAGERTGWFRWPDESVSTDAGGWDDPVCASDLRSSARSGYATGRTSGSGPASFPGAPWTRKLHRQGPPGRPQPAHADWPPISSGRGRPHGSPA